jgi:hypothetical protein
MTNERIKQLRKMANGDFAYVYVDNLAECLDEIVRLKADVQAANKAIVKLSKNLSKKAGK